MSDKTPGTTKEIDAELGDNLTAITNKTVVAPIGMPKLHRIVIEENDDIPPTGLFIGYNGKSFMIRAGFPVMVPQGVLDILDQSIVMVPVKDPLTLRYMGSRPRRRFPYHREALPETEPQAA